MKTLRKTIAVLLSIVMLLTLAPLGAFAEEEETISLWETKTVTLNNSGETVLYKFVPEETGNYVFESRSPDYATYVSLKNSDNSTLAASYNGGLGYNFRLVYEFQAGETYFFMTGFGVGGVTGSYPVKLYPEHNHIDADDDDICDICDWAMPWTTLTLDENGRAEAEANIQNNDGRAWFKFVPEATGVYVFESDLEDGDTEGWLYDADSETQLAYNDYIDGENYNFRLKMPLEAGKRYKFGVAFCNYSDTGIIPVSLTMDHACIDENNDYHCDNGGEIMPHECVDTDGNFICDDCYLPIDHACIDENEDYLCDCCSNPYGHFCEYNYECDPPVCKKCGVATITPISLNDSKIIYFTGLVEGIINTFIPEKSGTYIFFGKSADNSTTAVLYNSSFNDIAVDFSENSDFYFEAELEAGMTYYLMSGKMGYEYNSPLYTITVRCGHSSKTAYEAEEATCTALAHSAYEVCDICGERIGFVESGEFAAHNFVDGVCTECNEVEPEEPTTEPDEPTTNPEEPTTNPEAPTDPDAPACKHLCHKTGFVGFFWKIIRFFWKLFRIHPYCDCGAAHY